MSDGTDLVRAQVAAKRTNGKATNGHTVKAAANDERKPVHLITVGEAVEQLDALASLPVITTPFPTLNEALGFGGLLCTQLYSLPAGTGRGKTSFVANLARHAGIDGDVLFPTWEMLPGYIVARAAAGALGVRSNAIIRREVPARDVINALPPRIFFLHRPTLAHVREAADQLAQRAGRAPLVIADYLQKIADQIMAGQSRPDARIATAQASADLVNIAETVKCPVLVVSATSRQSGRRTADPRSMPPYELVDVARESGSVEFDSAATIVLSLSDDYEGDDRIGTITLAKARYGTECHIDARFDGSRGVWRDLGRTDCVNNALREAILDALRKAGSVESKSEIAKLAKKNKTAAMREIDAMVQAKLIVFDRDGYSLPGSNR